MSEPTAPEVSEALPLAVEEAHQRTAEQRPRYFLLIELLAVITTLACVWLTARDNILCWPTGIAGSLLYLYIFYHARLYSDVLLQLYFLITSIYGWYNWGHGGAGDTALKVSRLSLPAMAGWGVVIVIGTLLLGTYMKRRTRAAIPYGDASITVLSLVAQYLLTAKVLESWVLWIATDAIATVVYWKRRLYLTAGLYALLFMLACKGLMEWIKLLPP